MNVFGKRLLQQRVKDLWIESNLPIVKADDLFGKRLQSLRVCFWCFCNLYFNSRVGDKKETSAVRRNLITDSKVAKRALEIEAMMVTHTKPNINEYRPCHKPLRKIFDACNQCQELINICENGSNRFFLQNSRGCTENSGPENPEILRRKYFRTIKPKAFAM